MLLWIYRKWSRTGFSTFSTGVIQHRSHPMAVTSAGRAGELTRVRTPPTTESGSDRTHPKTTDSSLRLDVGKMPIFLQSYRDLQSPRTLLQRSNRAEQRSNRATQRSTRELQSQPDSDSRIAEELQRTVLYGTSISETRAKTQF